MTDHIPDVGEKVPPLGRPLNNQLGLEPERAAFARWCRENGHGELDDMLTPLDRSLRALMWPVWQGAMAAGRERMIADGWRQTRYVAPVTDCEACLTPDACAIRGQCGHYLRERA